MTDTQWKDLSAVFHPDDLEVRPGSKTRSGDKAMALFFVTSRAIMDRLDRVVGPQNWYVEYSKPVNASDKKSGVEARICIRIGDEWICKGDVSDDTDIEAMKGGYSGAIKRAAVHWGIGRYLYNFPSKWVPLEGNFFKVNARQIIDGDLKAYRDYLPEGYEQGAATKEDVHVPAPAPTRRAKFSAAERKQLNTAVADAKKKGARQAQINAIVKDENLTFEDMLARFESL